MSFSFQFYIIILHRNLKCDKLRICVKQKDSVKLNLGLLLDLYSHAKCIEKFRNKIREEICFYIDKNTKHNEILKINLYWSLKNHNLNTHEAIITPLFHLHFYEGASGGADGWGTVLQVRRSRVYTRMMSLESFIDNPSGCTLVLGLTQPLTEMSNRNISEGFKAAGA